MLNRKLYSNNWDISKVNYHSNTWEFPLTARKMKVTQWQPLIDKIIARISSWSVRKLSYAGRIQLIRVVLFGVQSYWSQMFLIPSKVIKTIEAYCRSFIWSGTNVITKRALISWEKVCKSKSAGGLNILNLKQWNRAAIIKLQWDLTTKADRL